MFGSPSLRLVPLFPRSRHRRVCVRRGTVRASTNRVDREASPSYPWENPYTDAPEPQQSSINKADGLLKKAIPHLRKRRFEEAIPLLRLATRHDAMNANVFVNLADAIDAFGKSTGDEKAAAMEARPFYARAAELLPQDVDLQEQFGHVLLKCGEKWRAVKLFEWLSSEQPEEAHFFGLVGAIYHSIGESSLAIPYLEHAVHLGHQDPSYTLELLMQCLRNIGKHDEAIETGFQALKQVPDQMQGAKAQYWTQIAEMKLHLKDWVGAAEASKNALSAEGDMPGNYFMTRAIALQHVGDQEGAMRHLRMAVEAEEKELQDLPEESDSVSLHREFHNKFAHSVAALWKFGVRSTKGIVSRTGPRGSKRAQTGGWGGPRSVLDEATECDFDYLDIPDPEVVWLEYISKNRPVLIDGTKALHGWPAWNLWGMQIHVSDDHLSNMSFFCSWTREELLKRRSDVTLSVANSSRIVLQQAYADPRQQAMLLGDFVARHMGRSGSASDMDPPYVFKQAQLPNLHEEYIDLFSPFYGDDASRWTLNSTGRAEMSLFFMGPPNSGAFFHTHGSTWNALLFGTKRWFLLPPGEDWGVKTMPIGQWVEQILPRAKGRFLECTQHAGEVLLVPHHWGHAVLNVEDAVGIAVDVGYDRHLARELLDQWTVRGLHLETKSEL